MCRFFVTIFKESIHEIFAQILIHCQARSQDLEKGGGLFWKSENRANDLDSNFHWTWISFRRFVRKLRRNFSESSEIQRFFPPKIRCSPKKKGLHWNWEWFFGRSPKFKGFYRPKSGVLQKNKKGLHWNWEWFFGRKSEIQRFFPLKIRCSPKKKKKVFTEIESDFSAEVRNSKVFTAQNQVFSKKIKKVFTEIESDFSAENPKFKDFFPLKIWCSPKKKRKRSSLKLRVIFRPKSEMQRFFPPKIRCSPKKKRSSPKLRLIFRPI